MTSMMYWAISSATLQNAIILSKDEDGTVFWSAYSLNHISNNSSNMQEVLINDTFSFFDTKPKICYRILYSRTWSKMAVEIVLEYVFYI